MKGMSAVEIDTICLGETSIKSTSDGGTKSTSLVVPYVVPPAPTTHTRALSGAAHQDTLVREGAVRGQLGVGLGDDVLLLLVGGQVNDLVGNLPTADSSVRRLDKAVLVYAAVGSQVAYEADVWPFWRLDRAHTPVVGAVHVSDLEASPFTGQHLGRAHG